MSDDPVTFAALERYNQEILLPQVQQTLGGLIEAGFDDMRGHFDAIYQRFDRLETEYQMLVAAVSRVEERFERVEGSVAALAEVQGKLALRGASGASGSSGNSWVFRSQAKM